MIKPYYIAGGFPKGKAWFFFTPFGKIKIENSNKLIDFLLPHCDGHNLLNDIVANIDNKYKKELIALVVLLLKHLILVDANRIFKNFYAYSCKPMLFNPPITSTELNGFPKMNKTVAKIKGAVYKQKFQKTYLHTIMDKRHSTRKFSKKALTSDQLFGLVWSTYGKQKRDKAGRGSCLNETFTVPSGGAFYPLLVYVVLFTPCGGIPGGIYLWHKTEGCLELISKITYSTKIQKIIYGIDNLKNATGVICIAADFEKTAIRAGNCAYNIIQQEVGHALQNAGLYCAENNLGLVEIAGYNDYRLANYLKINFPRIAPLAVAAFGLKKD